MDIEVTFPGGRKVDAKVGGFVVRTDQPPEGGGEGSAPAPFSYFLASLGTCAGLFVLAFLQSRNLPTEGVSLRQQHEFDPMTHKLERVRILVELPPEIPEKYHRPLVRAAEQCAVKRVLADPPAFEIEARVREHATSIGRFTGRDG